MKMWPFFKPPCLYQITVTAYWTCQVPSQMKTSCIPPTSSRKGGKETLIHSTTYHNLQPQPQNHKNICMILDLSQSLYNPNTVKNQGVHKRCSATGTGEKLDSKNYI